MFLLDTNVVSELRKAGDRRADPTVMAWIATMDAAALYISAITVLELELGVLRMERRDPEQGRRLRVWMNQRVLPEFANRILAVDAAVALRCAALHVPDLCAERDALIAATAMVHGMKVVTRNTADFEKTRVSLLNPWNEHNA